MKKTIVYRGVFYVLGLLILALGLTLNTKAGLGVSPIISVSYSISQLTGYNFGNTTMGLYIVFVLMELILHTIRDRQYEKHTAQPLKHASRVNTKLVLGMDLLQIPLSIVFTRFLNVFGSIFPEVGTQSGIKQLFLRLLVLFVALICTGVGAAMSLSMRIVPNPGDGIVQAIADCIHKSVGFTKNCFDVCNVCITITISLVFGGRLYGIGIGTVLAVIFVGRIIALFQHVTKGRLTELAGVEMG